MAASPINITALLSPGAAMPGGANGAGGALAGFEALMSAFFASTDAVLQDAAGAQPTQLQATQAQPHLLGPAQLGAPLQGPGEGLAQGAPATTLLDQLDLDAAAAPGALAQPLQVALATAETMEAGEAPPSEPAPAEDATGEPAADPASAMMALLAPAPPQPAPQPVTAEPIEPSDPPAAAEAPDALPPVTADAQPASEALEDAASEPRPGAHGLATAALQHDKAAQAPHPRATPATPAVQNGPAEPATPAQPAAPAQAEAGQAGATQTAAVQTPAPPASEKPAKPSRSAREPITPEATPTDAPDRNPQAATPAVSAAAQPGMTRDSRPGDAGVNLAEPRAAETAPDLSDAQPLLAEPAPAAPAGETSEAAATPSAVRGAPETVANLAAQIVRKLGARSTHFDLQLDPVGLGRVNVRVEINADGRVSAAMSFDNPQAAADLKSRANELQRALAQSGFDLSGGLSFDVTQDQGNPYAGQQNGFQDRNHPGQAFRGRAFAAALETAGEAAQSALTGTRRLTPSGVDVRI